MTGHIQQAQEVATMRCPLVLPQHAYLLEEGFELGGIDDPEVAEVLLGTSDDGGQGTTPRLAPCLELREDGMDYRLEEGSRQGAEPHGEGLLADLTGRCPEQLLPGQEPDQLGHRRDLTPDEGEHQS